MTISRTQLASTLVVGAAVSLSGACGTSGGGSGDAFLTIVGDRNLFLESGTRADLTVRYHDREDQPLHGEVAFSIEGEAYGAQLASSAAMTDDDGVATLSLDASNDELATFTVTATAAGAGSTSWEITIDEPRKPIDPNGAYTVESRFDVVTNLEGDAGNVINGILDITSDPGTYVLLWVADQCCISEDDARVFGPALTQFLSDNAPELVGEILALGDLLEDNLKNFTAVSELRIEGAAAARTASHGMSGAMFRHDGEATEVTVTGTEQAPAMATGVSIDADELKASVQVGEHSMPTNFGSLLAAGIEDVLIPAVNGSPTDLQGFFRDRIRCDKVVEYLDERYDLEWWQEIAAEKGCTYGVGKLAEAAMNEIRGLDDAGISLVIAGSAEATDPDEDGSANGLTNGLWEGRVEYGSAAAATLDSSDNRFTAERLD